jgi:hypothetical protein
MPHLCKLALWAQLGSCGRYKLLLNSSCKLCYSYSQRLPFFLAAKQALLQDA